MPLNRVIQCTLVIAFLGGLPLGASIARTQTRPNILFILADDLGWSDLGSYGNRFIETPVLDRLAEQGMRFTNAYTAPVCTPSRGMILSGQYSARTGLYKVPFVSNERPWARILPPENWGSSPVDGTTIGRVLTEAGYDAVLVGKTHVPPPFLEGLRVHPEVKVEKTLDDEFEAKVGAFVRANPENDVGLITQQAVRFIAANDGQPFFCYVGHYMPHIPIEARSELRIKYETKWKKNHVSIHPRYAAMCETVDESVGLILEALERRHLGNRTIVVFFSDNGGVRKAFSDNLGSSITDMTPLRGEKGGLYEGGIRVPLIIRWPGNIDEGTVCDTPVISTDFLPTIADIVGVRLGKEVITDGVSLLPLLKGNARLKREHLFFYFPDYHHDFPAIAIRAGHYKLIESAEDGHLELYNLATDIGETHNLAPLEGQLTSSLVRELHGWRESLGARLATRNPAFDEKKQDYLDPRGEQTRREYLPSPWPPLAGQSNNDTDVQL